MPEDKQVWAFDPKDLFSMKSACWGAVELSRSECSGSYSDVSHERRFWKLLWSQSQCLINLDTLHGERVGMFFLQSLI